MPSIRTDSLPPGGGRGFTHNDLDAAKANLKEAAGEDDGDETPLRQNSGLSNSTAKALEFFGSLPAILKRDIEKELSTARNKVRIAKTAKENAVRGLEELQEEVNRKGTELENAELELAQAEARHKAILELDFSAIDSLATRVEGILNPSHPS